VVRSRCTLDSDSDSWRLALIDRCHNGNISSLAVARADSAVLSREMVSLSSLESEKLMKRRPGNGGGVDHDA
jgi:hypothetical protein